MSFSRSRPIDGFSERSPMAISVSGLALATTMSCERTAGGRRGSARATWFCVCIAAMSGSVPGLKVSVIATRPLDEVVELK